MHPITPFIESMIRTSFPLTVVIRVMEIRDVFVWSYNETSTVIVAVFHDGPCTITFNFSGRITIRNSS
jgi:hypothetical protein